MEEGGQLGVLVEGAGDGDAATGLPMQQQALYEDEKTGLLVEVDRGRRRAVGAHHAGEHVMEDLPRFLRLFRSTSAACRWSLSFVMTFDGIHK